MSEGDQVNVRTPPNGGGRKLRAFDKATGKIVWETELPAGTTGTMMTYQVKGLQCIVVAIGGQNHPPEFIAFALTEVAARGAVGASLYFGCVGGGPFAPLLAEDIGALRRGRQQDRAVGLDDAHERHLVRDDVRRVSRDGDLLAPVSTTLWSSRFPTG